MANRFRVSGTLASRLEESGISSDAVGGRLSVRLALNPKAGSFGCLLARFRPTVRVRAG